MMRRISSRSFARDTAGERHGEELFFTVINPAAGVVIAFAEKVFWTGTDPMAVKKKLV
jgi:hypothetical protein